MASTASPIPIGKLSKMQAVACNLSDTAPPRGCFDVLVLVYIGHQPIKKEFQVHRGLLAHHSDMFKTNGANSQIDICLPEEDPDTFNKAVYWMYTTRFWPPAGSGWPSKDLVDAVIPLTPTSIIKMHFFAASYNMRALKNTTLTLFYQKLAQDWAAPTPLVAEVYAKSVPGSPMRTFLVDSIAQMWDSDLDKSKAMLPNAFFVDVLKALNEMNKVPGSGLDRDRWFAAMNESFCKTYHNHKF